MTTPLLKIRQPALLTQLQDLGRFGQMHRGISISGAMDDIAFTLNNQLLGNDPNAAQLEIAPGGIHIEILADTTIAIAGAYANPTLDNKPLTNYHSYRVRVGQQLRMTYPKNGQYSYLAIAGGFHAEPILGSRSTCARLALNPLPITRGTILHGTPDPNRPEHGIRWKDLPNRQENRLTVIPAYQYDSFSEEARTQFTAQHWKIKSSDRMGTLLTAPQGITWTAGELRSEGIMTGAVQISNNGMPIILQKDAQSIGGYPKIGVLTNESRAQLAQIRAGEMVRFEFRAIH